MNHTQLTARNFFGLSATAFFIGTVTVGFGVVDLVMVAPMGVTQLAAVGQGDLIVSCLFAGFLGIVDGFSAQMSAYEGVGKLRERFSSLSGGFILNALVASMIAVVLIYLVEPLLIATHQVETIVAPVEDYVSVQLFTVFPMLIFFASNEALKISGMKTSAVLNLAIGLSSNAALNYCFLYTSLNDLFASPAQAVSVATSISQTLMAVLGAIIFIRHLYPSWRNARSDLATIGQSGLALARIAPSIGIRRINDYASTVLPLLFIGTMSAEVVAASSVATKIFMLFCRVPQACLTAAFIFYGYTANQQEITVRGSRRTTAYRLASYSALPTALATAIVLIASDQLIGLFLDPGETSALPMHLLFAYMIIVPAYFCEQFLAELLVIHKEAGVLFTASTLVTYFISVPIAYVAVFQWGSPFWAIASKGLSFVLLSVTFWHSLRPHLDSEGALSHA